MIPSYNTVPTFFPYDPRDYCRVREMSRRLFTYPRSVVHFSNAKEKSSLHSYEKDSGSKTKNYRENGVILAHTNQLSLKSIEKTHHRLHRYIILQLILQIDDMSSFRSYQYFPRQVSVVSTFRYTDAWRSRRWWHIPKILSIVSTKKNDNFTAQRFAVFYVILP